MAEGKGDRHGALILLFIIFAGLVGATAPRAWGATAALASATPGQRSPFVAVGRLVGPSVVNIRTTRSVTQGGLDESPLLEMFQQFFPRPDDPGAQQFGRSGTGSGFVVSADGDILTNHHVIAGADAVYVRFSDQRREYTARVAGSDPNTDLALLKIQADRPLKPLEFGDSDAIEVGDWAIAIGNPFGNLEGSLTVGVISAKGRSDLVIVGGTPRYQDFIQTDASINFGNSGGPLVDIDGRVIGINTAVNTGGQGIGFAIPGNLARRVYEQLRDHGRVIRGYLGVQTETPLAQAPAGAGGGSAGSSDGDDTPAGAQVVSVLPDSPAARAGMQVGDLIVEFSGRPVNGQRELQFLVAETPPGREVPCVLLRGGARQTVRVTLTEMPARGAEDAAPDGPGRWLGMEVAGLSDPIPRVRKLKEALGVTGDRGVMVIDVAADGPAAAAGVKAGDVIVEADGQPLAGLDDYREVSSRASGRSDPVRLLIRTGKQESYVLVHPRPSGMEE